MNPLGNRGPDFLTFMCGKTCVWRSQQRTIHLSVVFCKHSLNTERTRVDKMKNEDLHVCEPPSPAPEAPTTSLLNDLKYSASGEY